MDPLSLTFAALADPTRRAILARLAQGETHVGALAGPLPISGPAVSRHLRVLEQARLIERSVDAQWRVCRLHGPGLRAARDWLDQYRSFWEHSLDRLTELLESPEEASPPPAAAASSAPSRRPAATRRPAPQPSARKPAPRRSRP